MPFEGANKDALDKLTENFEKVLKVQYEKNDFAGAFRLKAAGLLPKIKTKSQIGGKNLTMDQELGTVSTHSSNFKLQQALGDINSSATPNYGTWVGNPGKYHANNQIDLESMFISDNMSKSFIDKAVVKTMQTVDSFWQHFSCAFVWGPGKGAVGLVRSTPTADTSKTYNRGLATGGNIVSTHVFKVISPEQARSLNPGTLIEFWDNTAPDQDSVPVKGGQRALTQPDAPYGNALFAKCAVVVAVEYTFGTGTKSPRVWIRAKGAVNTIAANDIIYKAGDGEADRYQSSIPEWVPVKEPSGPFFGMDRSFDPIRLGGFRASLSANENILQTVDNLLTNAVCYGDKNVRPSAMWMNPFMQRALTYELGKGIGNSITYPTSDEGKSGRTAQYGYQKVQLDTLYGKFPLELDDNCPLTRIYGLHQPGLVIVHRTPKLLYMVKGTAGKFVRLSGDENKYESRWVCMSNMFMKAVGKNFVAETRGKTGFWSQ